MKRCVNCHKYIYLTSSSDWCGCEPVKAWIETDEETEKDAKSYFTKDSEELANEIAEEYWSSDPSDTTTFELIVAIKGIYGGIERFIVTAEVNVDFSSELIKEG